jgi:hypothetical protein
LDEMASQQQIEAAAKEIERRLHEPAQAIAKAALEAAEKVKDQPTEEQRRFMRGDYW